MEEIPKFLDNLQFDELNFTSGHRFCSYQRETDDVNISEISHLSKFSELEV